MVLLLSGSPDPIALFVSWPTGIDLAGFAEVMSVREGIRHYRKTEDLSGHPEREKAEN